MENLYLAHHGVKGMKWGVRRYQNYDGSLIGAKKRKKAAKKQYNKDFNSAYNFSSRHPVSQYIKKSKNYSESIKRWDKAFDSADKYNKAKTDYKNAKKEAKENKEPFNLSEKQKKALKIGAIAIGTALATYGAIKLNESITQKAISQGGKKFVMSSLDRKTLRNQYIKSSVRDIKQKTFDTIERAASNAKDTASKIKSSANFTKRYTDTATRASYGKKFVLTPEQRAKARRDYAKYVLPNKFNPKKALDKAPRGPYREGKEFVRTSKTSTGSSLLNEMLGSNIPENRASARKIDDKYAKMFDTIVSNKNLSLEQRARALNAWQRQKDRDLKKAYTLVSRR